MTSNHHISAACGQGCYRIMTHDNVKFCIKDLLNHSCDVKTRAEVAECFRVAEPDNNQCPDIMLYNAPGFNKPVVADVCIPRPIPVPAASTNLTLTAARNPGRSAEVARKGKIPNTRPPVLPMDSNCYSRLLLSLLVALTRSRVMIS
jgi:hypothetical protein